MQDNNNNHNRFGNDRNRGFGNNRDRGNNRFGGDRNRFGGDRNRDNRRFEQTDVTFKDKTDEQIVQILLEKQKKIGRNLFGSDIHPLYELIIRQNKRIKILEEKLNSSSKKEEETELNNI
jgi:hypothetical protein